MADSLEAHGYFKQQLLRDYSSGRQVFKGFSLKSQSVVLIQQQSFPESRQALLHCEEMKQFQALPHPAAGTIVDCFMVTGKPHWCYVVQRYVKDGLDNSRKWTVEETEAFLLRFVELFEVAQARGIYYRNIAPANFRSDETGAISLFEFAGYYYLKQPSAYISPTLRRYLEAAEDEDGLGSPLPFHNPYKAEMYSLAVVALEMVHGRYLRELEGADENARRRLEALIDSCEASERVKDLMKLMADFNEETRLDPLQASLYLASEMELAPAAQREQHQRHLSIIQVKLDAPSLPDLQRFTVLSCVCCFVPIRVESSTDLQRLEVLVPLKCPVKNHVFCQVECVMKYAFIETQGQEERIDSLRCPICDYKLPDDLRARIRSLWQEDAHLTILHRARSAHESPAKPTELFRRSVPVFSPVDFSPEVLDPQRDCVLCRSRLPAAGKVAVHEGGQHSFCSAKCARKWLSGFEGVEISCPIADCGECISAEFVTNQTRDEEEEEKHVIKFIHSVSAPNLNRAACMQCGDEIVFDDSRYFTAETQPVFLYCVPAEHVFCCKSCFRSYVETCTNHFRLGVESVKCPLCAVEVEAELIYDSFGGEDHFNAIRALSPETPHCLECKIRIGEQSPCGHAFCATCKMAWAQEALLTACIAVPCPVCKQPTKVGVHNVFARVYDYVRSSLSGSP